MNKCKKNYHNAFIRQKARADCEEAVKVNALHIHHRLAHHDMTLLNQSFKIQIRI